MHEIYVEQTMRISLLCKREKLLIILPYEKVGRTKANFFILLLLFELIIGPINRICIITHEN